MSNVRLDIDTDKQTRELSCNTSKTRYSHQCTSGDEFGSRRLHCARRGAFSARRPSIRLEYPAIDYRTEFLLRIGVRRLPHLEHTAPKKLVMPH
jgi:hypothetical protein